MFFSYTYESALRPKGWVRSSRKTGNLRPALRLHVDPPMAIPWIAFTTTTLTRWKSQRMPVPVLVAITWENMDTPWRAAQAQCLVLHAQSDNSKLGGQTYDRMVQNLVNKNNIVQVCFLIAQAVPVLPQGDWGPSQDQGVHRQEDSRGWWGPANRPNHLGKVRRAYQCMGYCCPAFRMVNMVWFWFKTCGFRCA